MKLFARMKDGGPESRVWGYWLIESKRFFSIVLLHFKDGSREAYHSHAFNAISWVLSGQLTEWPFGRGSIGYNLYEPSLKPVWTPRHMMHRVVSLGDTWVISFRGPWANTWREYIPETKEILTLTHGRKVIATQRESAWTPAAE